jgi:hypothetical protein
MENKVETGGKILKEDILEVIDMIEKRILRGGRASIDLTVIPLVAAEVELLFLEEHWPYEQNVKETIGYVREWAKIVALKVIEDRRKGEDTNN